MCPELLKLSGLVNPNISPAIPAYLLILTHTYLKLSLFLFILLPGFEIQHINMNGSKMANAEKLFANS